MRRALLLSGLLLGCLATTAPADDKGTSVTLDVMTSKAPASWVKVDLPARSMRFVQFKVPKAKGDKEDADLAIFKGLGGSVSDNVARWTLMSSVRADRASRTASRPPDWPPR